MLGVLARERDGAQFLRGTAVGSHGEAPETVKKRLYVGQKTGAGRGFHSIHLRATAVTLSLVGDAISSASDVRTSRLICSSMGEVSSSATWVSDKGAQKPSEQSRVTSPAMSWRGSAMEMFGISGSPPR